MGIWPLTFGDASSIAALGPADAVSSASMSLPTRYASRMTATVAATTKDGSARTFDVVVKVATLGELDTVLAGALLAGILSEVLKLNS